MSQPKTFPVNERSIFSGIHLSSSNQSHTGDGRAKLILRSAVAHSAFRQVLSPSKNRTNVWAMAVVWSAGFQPPADLQWVQDAYLSNHHCAQDSMLSTVGSVLVDTPLVLSSKE